MNTSDFKTSFSAISRTKFLTAQSLLRFSKFCSVFSSMAGIVNLRTSIGYKQVFNANVNTNTGVRLWQYFIFKLAQARYEIAPCAVFANSDGARRAWQQPRPFDIQWLFVLGNVYIAIFVLKPAFSKFSRLLVLLRLERRIFSPTLKEVLKSSLLMPKCLLSRNARYVVQKTKFRQFFKLSQFSTGLNVAYFSLALVILISTPAQDRVIHHPNTAKRLSQQFCLALSWVKSEFIGSIFHISHYNDVIVSNQVYRFLPSVNDGYPR